MARKGDGFYKKKNGRWQMDTVIDGQRYRETFDASLTREQAKKLVGVRRSEIILGNAGIRKKKNPTFNSACDLFLKSLEANPKQHTKTFYEQCIRQLKGVDSKGKQTKRTEFTGKRLADITKFGVETFKRKRARVAKVRVNRELVTLKRIYNFMIVAGKFDGPNPVKGIKLLPEPKERLIFLEHDEEETL